jgi:hypothetical protein
VNGFCADARTYHVQTVDFALVAMFKYTCGLEFYPDFGYDSVTTAGHGTLDLCCLSKLMLRVVHPGETRFVLFVQIQTLRSEM